MCSRTDCAGTWAGELACQVCEEGKMWNKTKKADSVTASLTESGVNILAKAFAKECKDISKKGGVCPIKMSGCGLSCPFCSQCADASPAGWREYITEKSIVIHKKNWG